MKKEMLLELIGLAIEKNGTESGGDLPFEIGTSYFIRTVTYHMIGTIEEIKGSFLVLSDASWVADSGKFSKAIGDGVLSEVEYVGAMIVNLNSIADAFPWTHKNPTVTK